MAHFTFRSETLRSHLSGGELWWMQRLLPQQRPRQLVLVFDTNLLVSEATFHAKKPNAKSALHEAIDSGVVIPVIPGWAIGEALRTLKKVDCAGRPFGRTQQRLLHDVLPRFYVFDEGCIDWADPRLEALELRDPKDVPFAKLQGHLNADAILTDDKDFESLDGVPILKKPDGRRLREYARGEATATNITSGSHTTAMVSVGGIGKLVQTYPWLSLAAAILGGLSGYVIWRFPRFAKVKEKLTGFGRGILSAVDHVYQEHRLARTKADEAWSSLSSSLDASELAIREQYFRTLLLARRPMTSRELAAILRPPVLWGQPSVGMSRAIGQAFRYDRRVCRGRDGRWHVKGLVDPIAYIKNRADLRSLAGGLERISGPTETIGRA